MISPIISKLVTITSLSFKQIKTIVILNLHLKKNFKSTTFLIKLC